MVYLFPSWQGQTTAAGDYGGEDGLEGEGKEGIESKHYAIAVLRNVRSNLKTKIKYTFLTQIC